MLPVLLQEAMVSMELAHMGDHTLMESQGKMLISYLDHLEMGELQNLIKVFRNKESYHDKARNVGTPLMRYTVCLSDQELNVARGDQSSMEELLSLKEFTQSLIMSLPGSQLKVGQAAASGLERGVQGFLEPSRKN